MSPDTDYCRHPDTYSILSLPLSPARRPDLEHTITQYPSTLVLSDQDQQQTQSGISKAPRYRVGLSAVVTATAILHRQLRLRRARVKINPPTGEKLSQDQTSPPQRNGRHQRYQLQRLVGAGTAIFHLASMVIDRIDPST